MKKCKFENQPDFVEDFYYRDRILPISDQDKEAYEGLEGFSKIKISEEIFGKITYELIP